MRTGPGTEYPAVDGSLYRVTRFGSGEWVVTHEEVPFNPMTVKVVFKTTAKAAHGYAAAKAKETK